ncbi:MAG: histidinol-phosphate transaminase [Leptonema sp. (in: bacteria)]
MNDLKKFIPENILKMSPYVPGLQLNEEEIIKLNTNENPYPLPEFILDSLLNIVKKNRFHLYPDPESLELRKKLSNIYKKDIKNILIGNGSDEILSIVFRTFLTKEDRVLFVEPSYSLYSVLCNSLGVNYYTTPVEKDFTIDIDKIIEYEKKYDPKLIIITNPNAPTGISLSKKKIKELCENIQKPILIDEAYVFFGGESVSEEAGILYPHLMVCSTFSKAFSLAGMRLGWILANEFFIEQMNKIKDSYNINFFSQKTGELVLDNLEYFYKRIEEIIQTREWFIRKMDSLGYFTLPSSTNFVFTSPPDKQAKNIYEYLLKNKILVRYFSNYPEFLRISIGTQKQMETLYEILKNY